MFQEQPAFKQAKYVGLKAQDREIYFNYKLRQWFDGSNRFYNTDTNGVSIGNVIDLQVRYEDLCNEIKTKYPQCPIFAGNKYRANVKLTEPVKILIKNRDVAKHFERCITTFVKPIFNELANESKLRKTNHLIKTSIESPIEPVIEPMKEEEPIQEIKKQKIIDFQSVLAEFADEDWE